VIDVLKNQIFGQVFITSTNLSLKKYADEKDKVFHVKHGEIVESDS
jgi:recombinational DNA repair ATPase RecF